MSTGLPEIRCVLCDEVIGVEEDYFRATGDFFPPGDPLHGYCNRPMHWDCYANWEHRPRFAKHYVNAWVQANRGNPFWWSVYRDEDVYVAANPSPPIEEAVVRLSAVGSDIHVPLPRWPEWVKQPAKVTPNLQGCEQAALKPVLPLLRERFPTDHAVVDAIDPAEKQRGSRKRA